MLRFNQLTQESMSKLSGGGGRTRRVQKRDINGDGITDKIVTIRDGDGNLIREKVVFGR